ncbi:hypothetical protein SAMN05444414_11268 [Roseovarius marisflavi]|uniref:Uncharacterized protein n=1 Tax=Roseovarius marisflavi TaxID=1054996 RepID=A0A1M7A638_9RHOB|nr:hypothetical protein SAMN05444414_11268 [Roseovarius marisflavi]
MWKTAISEASERRAHPGAVTPNKYGDLLTAFRFSFGAGFPQAVRIT